MLVSLTPEFLATKLVCPPGKTRFEFVDQGGVRGMYVEARPKSPGEGTFYLRYKINGKTCHQRLGGTRDMTLAEARAAAKKLKAKIVLGGDPRQEARDRRSVPTLTEFFEGPYRECKIGRKASFSRDEMAFRLRIKPRFGSRRLDALTRQEIIAFHNSVRDSGLSAASANHDLRLLRHMGNIAITHGIIEKNPAARIPLFFEDNKVERYLEGEELERLLSVLRTHPSRMVCSICIFLLSTGCRLGEALSARWDDIDMDRRVFVVRVSNSKSKKRRVVPLNDAALEVLRAVPTHGVFEYVFANEKTGKPYTRFGHTWDRIRRKAGLADLRLHDLRHSFASFLVNSGRSLYEVQQLLGHSSPVISQRYAHLSTKTLQEASASASVKLSGGTKPTA